jgi:CheY-like chemotaxis protein
MYNSSIAHPYFARLNDRKRKCAMYETILIADDDAEVREILREALEQAGYVTLAAADGNEALMALRTMQFDLLITDIVMPERDGLEMIDVLRYERTAPKVIAMSGAWDGVCLPAAMKLGAQALLPKPWKNQTLLDTVRAVLDGKASVPQPRGSDAVSFV